MRNLLLLIVKFHSLLLFIGLEVLSFYLIVTYNQHQREIFINSSNLFSAKILNQKDKFREYLKLQEVNDSLVTANSYLIRRLIELEGYGVPTPLDTNLAIELISAKVISQSINLRNNTLTVDKGWQHGVNSGMGILSHDGIVGIVTNTSQNFAQGISILNSNARISARVKSKGYFGNLFWDGQDPRLMILEAVPKHAEISTGDTIVTSGYSRIFPPDLIIGTIASFEVKRGRSNFTIDVRLNNDPSKIKYVYIAKNRNRKELDTLTASDQ